MTYLIFVAAETAFTRGELQDDRLIQVPQIRGIIKSDTQRHCARISLKNTTCFDFGRETSKFTSKH